MDIAYRGYRIYAILTSRSATLLEATGPLNFIGAQVVYLGQPIITHVLPEDHINAFADLLENPEETKAFTHYLRQEHRVD
jgi:hypothetical protein